MKYLHALNKIEGVGPRKLQTLLAFFGTPENIWQADRSDLQAALGGEKIPEKIFHEKQLIDPDTEWQRLQDSGIRLIDLPDPDYPELLKEIDNPPYLLYVRGTFPAKNIPAIAIVGSRKFSRYGEQAASAFARDLSRAGFTIVSGLALGIDAIAHRGALEAKGPTIAVLGSGVDDESIYPRAHLNLAKEIIASGGLVLSDYPPGMRATNITFPARNRIIAGLSLGTLVIEAGEKSGTLITAGLALENNREVFAIPGSIFSPASVGTNALIKSGAKLVACVQDILEEFDLLQEKRPEQSAPKAPENEEEKILLRLLSDMPTHVDTLARSSGLTVAKISSVLTMMEIKGWTKNLGGQNYILL